MTEQQLQIAIAAKEMSVNNLRRILSTSEGLPRYMVTDFWQELKKQTDKLENLKELAAN